jgi:hypothetical protein
LDLGLAVYQDGSSKELAIRSSTRQNATESYPRIRAGHGRAPAAAVAFAVLSSLDLSFRCEGSCDWNPTCKGCAEDATVAKVAIDGVFQEVRPDEHLIDLVNRAGGRFGSLRLLSPSTRTSSDV